MNEAKANVVYNQERHRRFGHRWLPVCPDVCEFWFKQILAKVAELSDGTLMLNMKRCQSIDIEKKGARSVAVARDLCRTWTCLRLKVGMACEVQRHGQWVPC